MTRESTVLYDNELVDGVWRRRPAADKAVARGRSRPWTAGETAAFHHEVTRAEVRVHREVPDEDERLAVVRDARRAAALAEPVRRIAQPRRRAPGVDYRRLSTAEHRWVFDGLIAPSYLSAIITRPDPSTVYVLGQPGAGKLLAVRMVRRAMRPGTTHLIGAPDDAGAGMGGVVRAGRIPPAIRSLGRRGSGTGRGDRDCIAAGSNGGAGLDTSAGEGSRRSSAPQSRCT
ncbi:hypothetical protein ABZ383_31735 [Streptomyces sp. NPDC005900]|uniref:hypothetical protein n=1 Tax=Streptomyces sp. NPDC005900 TaxID=3154569 RepID=UPI0033E326C7